MCPQLELSLSYIVNVCKEKIVCIVDLILGAFIVTKINTSDKISYIFEI